MADQRRKLTVIDRTTIDLRLPDGWGIRQIALAFDRSAGTVSDEVNRNGGQAAYEARAAASQAAAKRELTGRKPRMARDGALFTEAASLLGLGCSPEQISGRRKRKEAGMEHPSGLRVSHEAIYASLDGLATRRAVARTDRLPAPRQACPWPQAERQ